ncbi:MAG: FkbM family methyltransferase [Alphaproteobacteria bacterium]|nr:FkbM family methyltransferase [Alphaproteobacteria bacterium]
MHPASETKIDSFGRSHADEPGSLTVLKQCRYGKMLFLRYDRYIGRSLDLYGEYSELEAEIFARNVRPGDCVVEVGSNIGAHTVRLAQLAGPHGVVHAFEPQRIIFQLLCANLAINGINNVWACQEAAGHRPGTMRVPVIDYAAEGNFGGLSLTNSGPGEDVPMRTIDSMPLRQLHMLKIDSEGMEKEVLSGARAVITRCRPVLYVENDRRDQSPELIQLIDELGYDMWWHLPRLYNPDNFAKNPNNAFGRIVSVNLLCLPKERAAKLPDLLPVSGPNHWWEKGAPGFSLSPQERRSQPEPADLPAPASAAGQHALPAAALEALTDPQAGADSETQLRHAMALHRQGRLGEAKILYEAILKQAPAHFNALHMLAIISYQTGHYKDGLALVERAIAINPDVAAAHSNRGILLQAAGRLNDALASYNRAIELKPDYPEAFSNRGNVLRRLNRVSEALKSYDRALALNPSFSGAYSNRGDALRDLKRPSEALASFDRALQLKPDYAEAFNNRGNALVDLKRDAEALASFDRALALKPDYVDAWSNRGNALRAMKRPEEALASYDRALELDPRYAYALNNRGNALRDLDRPEAALASYDRALALKPDYAHAHSNRGNALKDLMRLDEALASFDRAIELDPDYAEGHKSRGMARLLTGDYRGGWADYEWRWRAEGLPDRFPKLDAPAWQGEDLAGRSIAIYVEQGIGDVIQFARYLPLLHERGAQVTFFARPNLVRLLQPLTLGIDVVTSNEAAAAFDFQCALMSLPLRFGTELSSVPNSVPYLAAESHLVSIWREKIGGHGLKIGIAWQGRPGVSADKGRSIPLAAFAPLAAVPDVRLISLQRNFGLEQLAKLPAGMKVEVLSDEVESGPDAFIGTAAVMNCLDLIVTCDTSIAHLAGALARPTWVAVKHVAEWRWLLDRDDSPWYPTIRLFRQRTRGDWDFVLQEMARALQ